MFSSQSDGRWPPLVTAAVTVSILALLLAVVPSTAATLDGPANPDRSAVPGAHVTPLDLSPDALIYGDEAGSNLSMYVRGKPFFDFNGDGTRDFMVSFWTRAFHPEFRHQHIDIVLGQDEWPAESRISDLRNRVELDFPDDQDIGPADPTYRLVTNLDINGDRKDDIVVRRTDFLREQITAVELQAHYGREVDTSQPGRPPFIAVAEDEPDFRIRQPNPPRNSAEAANIPMPDQLQAGDFNGDGERDLGVASCDLEGPGHTGASKGALMLFFGPLDGSTVDLSVDEADSILYSSDEVDVCSASTTNLDADNMTDFLLKGVVTRNRQDFHYGAVIYGRQDWEPTHEVAALIGTRFVNPDPAADVDVAVKDVDGDGKRDIRGLTSAYRTPRWQDGPECDWFAGEASYPEQLDTDTCGFRFTGETPVEMVDVDGDGALDYIFETQHRGTAPFQWPIVRGPIERGGEMYVTEDPSGGDYLMSLPYTSAPIRWRFGNVGGERPNDLLVSAPESRHRAPDDGYLTIKLGPIADPVGAPTHTPPPPTDTPAPVPPTPTEPAAAPNIDLAPRTTIHGGEASAGLNMYTRGKPFFDFNGDRKRDFMVSFWTRAFHPEFRHQHIDIVLGTDEWPTEAAVHDLRNRVELVFPDPEDISGDDPTYRLVTNLDVNGDRMDDLVVERTEYQRGNRSAVELRIHPGREVDTSQPGRPPVIEITEEQPSLRIRQPQAPRNDAEEETVPMPDRLFAADLNGDGERDLGIGSCDLKGPDSGGDSGAMLIYLGPLEGEMIDLSTDTPDAMVYSADGIDVCSARTLGLDTDEATDLLLQGSTSRARQDYHFGAVVLGRSTWPASSSVADLVSTRFVSAEQNGDVDVSIEDVDGDGKRDILGRTYTYRTPSWDRGPGCVWYAGQSDYPETLTTDQCDFSFTGKVPDEIVDVNGDDVPDYIASVRHRGTAPFEWNVTLGPIDRDGELYLSGRVGSADYVLSLPYRSDSLRWRFGNVDGSGGDEFLVFAPESRYEVPGDGYFTIQFEPLVAPEPTPTPTVTAEPGTPTATLEPGVTPTATVETPEPPTHAIYLPACRNAWED